MAAAVPSVEGLLAPDAPDATAQALHLTGGGTIRGDAFDSAALGIFADRMDAGMRATMAELADQYPDDPAGLATALDAFAQGWKGQLPKPARVMFEATFQRQRLAMVRKASRRFEARLGIERAGAYQDSLDARRAGLYRLALDAGTDEAANAALAAELEDFTRFVGGHEEVTPARRARVLADVNQEIAAARVLGAFEKAGTPEERADAARRFEAEWEAGGGAMEGVTVETYKRITRDMERRLAADERTQSGARREAAAIDRDGRGDIEKAGYDLVRAGQMNEDWLEAHRDDLSVTAYRSFSRAAGDLVARPARTDPRIYVDLLDLAERDPDEATAQAREAYAEGTLARDAFEAIERRSRPGSGVKERSPALAQARTLIETELKPRPPRRKAKSATTAIP
jgi:hypothetical protein